MLNFTWQLPTRFLFGRDTELEVGRQVRENGGTRALIVYGGGSALRSGLIERVEGALDEAGVTHLRMGGVKPNPRDTLVREGIELGRKEGVDFLLAVGGGSVIDTAKAIAHGLKYDGDFWDFFCGKATDLKVSVKKPDGTTVSFSAMTENSLLLNAFGTYVVTYSAKDSFGNTTTKNVNVNVLDLSAPVITVNDNIPQTLTVGKTLSLGNCVYSDDVGVTEKHIFVVNPDGLYEEVNGSYTFGKFGSYMIVYYARDGEGNRTLVRYNVYVG